ncbi:MAG: hypothetical protein K6D38_08480 [Pseudobutyrivibrio sp.]|nr:hypothetical protein [Pseudobutyrivibrio sp.]
MKKKIASIVIASAVLFGTGIGVVAKEAGKEQTNVIETNALAENGTTVTEGNISTDTTDNNATTDTTKPAEATTDNNDEANITVVDGNNGSSTEQQDHQQHQNDGSSNVNTGAGNNVNSNISTNTVESNASTAISTNVEESVKYGEFIYNGVHVNINSKDDVVSKLGNGYVMEDLAVNADRLTAHTADFYYYNFGPDPNSMKDSDMYLTYCKDNGESDIYDTIIFSDKVVLANGIKVGDDINFVKKTMGKPSFEDSKEGYLDMRYKTEAVTYYFSFKDGKVASIIISNNKLENRYCPSEEY